MTHPVSLTHTPQVPPKSTSRDLVATPNFVHLSTTYPEGSHLSSHHRAPRRLENTASKKHSQGGSRHGPSARLTPALSCLPRGEEQMG